MTSPTYLTLTDDLLKEIELGYDEGTKGLEFMDDEGGWNEFTQDTSYGCEIPLGADNVRISLPLFRKRHKAWNLARLGKAKEVEIKHYPGCTNILFVYAGAFSQTVISVPGNPFHLADGESVIIDLTEEL